MPASAGTLTGLPTRFRVFYHCRKPGKVDVEAQLPVKGYNDLVWKWAKQCTDDVPVHLSIGTEERGEDIVAEGKVEAAWNASAPTVEFPPTQTLVTAHVSTTEDQAFYEPEFEVEPPIAAAAVEGHFDPAVASVPASFPHDQPVAFLAKNQHAPFVVRVSCHKAGLATVVARIRTYALYDGCGSRRRALPCPAALAHTLRPATPRFRPLLLGWKHHCGGVPRPNLAVATQVLHEGVEEDDANVARNGAVLPTWRQLNYTADAQQLSVSPLRRRAAGQAEGGEGRRVTHEPPPTASPSSTMPSWAAATPSPCTTHSSSAERGSLWIPRSPQSPCSTSTRKLSRCGCALRCGRTYLVWPHPSVGTAERPAPCPGHEVDRVRASPGVQHYGAAEGAGHADAAAWRVRPSSHSNVQGARRGRSCCRGRRWRCVQAAQALTETAARFPRIARVQLCGGFKRGASVAIDRRYVAGSDDGGERPQAKRR